MADLSDLQQSEAVRIVGNDEALACDVKDVDGANSLSVNVENQLDIKGTLVSGSGLKTAQIRTSTSIPTGSGFLDVLNVTGTGVFYGSKINFSNESVEFRVEIDGIESILVDFDFLDDLNFEAFSDTGLQRWFGKGSYGELEFFPSTAVGYETSLKIQVRKTVTFNINIKQAIILYA